MFATTDHPFHIQTIAFFASLVPIVALFVLLFVEALVWQRRRKTVALAAPIHGVTAGGGTVKSR
jgi:hypothetical protein